MANRLQDFTSSDPIFVDTNIFTYHQTAHPRYGPACREFLNRVESGLTQAVISNVVVNEALYVAQIGRAAALLGTPNRSMIAARLAADAAVAAECAHSARQLLLLLEALQRGSLTVVDAEWPQYHDICDTSAQSRLFITDATHAVLCRQWGIANIASNDADLDRVSFLTRWAPET
jgi:predicted nucleic acid-binding protein